MTDKLDTPATTAYGNINELLSQCTVQMLLDSRQNSLRRVITIASDVSLADAMKTLKRYNILSAPLVDATSKEKGPNGDGDKASRRLNSSFGSIKGFVSVKSIVIAILDMIDGKLHDKTHSEKKVPMLTWLSELEKITPSLHNTSVEAAMENHGELLFEAKNNMPLKTLIDSGFLNEKNEYFIHRVGVYDDSGRISNIVSQSDVLRFTSQNIDSLGSLGEKSIGSLDIVNKDHVSVSAGSMVIEVLLRMRRESLSAVAIVDGRAGVLVGNFSLSDLRGLAVDHMGVLGLPIAEYLALLHNTEYAGYTAAGSRHASHPHFDNREEHSKRLSNSLAIQRLVTCTIETSFKDALRVLSDSRLHRIYMVDAECRPIGVATITDLMSFALDIVSGPAIVRFSAKSALSNKKAMTAYETLLELAVR